MSLQVIAPFCSNSNESFRCDKSLPFYCLLIRLLPTNMVMLYFHLCLLLLLFHIVRRMSVLSSGLFVLAPVYHCSLVVLLHCAASWINKQTNKQTNATTRDGLNMAMDITLGTLEVRRVDSSAGSATDGFRVGTQ